LRKRYNVTKSKISINFKYRKSAGAESGYYSGNSITIINPQDTSPTDFYMKLSKPLFRPIKTAIHEFSHLLYSIHNKESQKLANELKKRGKHVSVYGNMSGWFEGTIEAITIYILDPEALRRYDKDTYYIVNKWEKNIL
jgi:hypothetical protein